MPQLNRSALVMYSADEMYRLVNDVLSYPEFLPDCSNSKIVSQGEQEVTASVEISKGGLTKWFTTKNHLVPGSSVTMQLVDGPFKQLQGSWTFKPLDEQACKVELDLQFEFSSKLIELAFGKVFNHVAANMVSAFTQRAKAVYGSRL